MLPGTHLQGWRHAVLHQQQAALCFERRLGRRIKPCRRSSEVQAQHAQKAPYPAPEAGLYAGAAGGDVAALQDSLQAGAACEVL